MADATKIQEFFSKIKDLNANSYMEMVSEHLDDDAIEAMADHIQDFYGIQDEESVGSLTQVMVTGFLAAKSV